MSQIDKRIKVNTIIENQLPTFLLSDFPNAVEFFKQYYISQEFQGGVSDLINNFNQYQKVDNLVPEVIVGLTSITADVSTTDTVINVPSTKGFPSEYGLLKINDEIISYTGITTNSFTGCIRGFSGITGYNVGISSSLLDVNKEKLTFEDTSASNHISGTEVKNLSVLFLQEFYKKLKRTFLPGFEDITLATELDVGNFVKFARSFYQAKGTEESITILFKVLFGVESKILDLESNLIKPSKAEFNRREIVVADLITETGDPSKLVGQTIFKSNDLNTNASVSEVEIFTREGKSYYKLSLFVGYSDSDLIQGIFNVSGKTKVINPVSIGSSIISVDSTIGFGATGTIISGSNTIDYTSKSVNQFFGCTGVVSNISTADDIRINENIFGYEDGDLSKKIELRITGVLSDFKTIDDINLVNEGENIYVKNVGEKVNNNSESYKEIFANVWQYNTSSRFQVEIAGATFKLKTKIDKASLRVGDKFDILRRNEQTIDGSGVVQSVDALLNQITVTSLGGFTPAAGEEYDIRRIVLKAKSTKTAIGEGNDNIISDVLNVYTDGEVDGYVASNSLPSYSIDLEKVVESTEFNQNTLLGVNETDTDKFSFIKFNPPVGEDIKFLEGDAVVYNVQKDVNSTDNNPATVASGLVDGQLYFVDPQPETGNTKISRVALYLSRSQIGSASTVQIGAGSSALDKHVFTLQRHSGKDLSSNKILRKYPLSQNLQVTSNKDDVVDDIGILKNGVEIRSPISNDRIFFGPIEKIDLANEGSDYDIINPPTVEVESSTGTTALIEPILSGSVENVFVDPQDFDIQTVKSISLTGGNGSGCELQALTGARFRSIEFDARPNSFGGGLDLDEETITFKGKHNLETGQKITYKNNGYNSLGIGPAFNTTSPQVIDGTLADGDSYFVRVINSTTIRIFNSESDAKFNTGGAVGVNTIGIATDFNASGIHEFRTESKNTILGVKVLNSGAGYQHRKLRVPPSGISTSYDKIFFDNHGFNAGEIIEYSNDVGQTISGLSTSISYFVMDVDDNSFRLANAGVGATNTTNFDRGKFVNLTSQGTDYHCFSYPKIQVNVEVVYGSTVTGSFNFTPVITGSLTGGYLYEKGTNYGSNILNHENIPDIKLKTGKNAGVKASISNGKIKSVVVTNKGKEYSSPPKIVVSDSTGTGAILRPVIENKQLVDVIVINSGIGYNSNTIQITVESRGKNGLYIPRLRNLTLNDQFRFGSETFIERPTNLSYSILSYSQKIAEDFEKDTFTISNSGEFVAQVKHSPIIGWANDGNPIYGPFGYTDPENINSPIKILTPSYSKDINQVFNRPSGFEAGFFNEDYILNNTGDLDSHNGRFSKTPEFPNGIYAYFATVEKDINGKLSGVFPYFIGKTYRLPLIQDNQKLNQDFDFNNSNLLRNTFPYSVGEKFADNDFIIESNEIVRQSIKVETVEKGGVENLIILDGGSNYKVGDKVVFDENDTGGSGFSAEVNRIVGIGVSTIETELESFESVVFTRKNESTVQARLLPSMELTNLSAVQISGLSTSIKNLTNTFNIGVRTETVGLAKSMVEKASGVARVQDIFVNKIPNGLSVGGSIKVGSGNTTSIEFLEVLNIFPTERVIRVLRSKGNIGAVAIAHTFGSNVDSLNNKFEISVKTDEFESKDQDIVYFNPVHSIAVGTSGIGSAVTVNVGETSTVVQIPERQIYLPNHPFRTGQKVTLNVPNVTNNKITVSPTTNNSDAFQIPFGNQSQTSIDLFVIKKGENYIGLSTVAIGSTSQGLYFKSNASTSGPISGFAGISSFFYNLTSNFTQLTGDVDKITSTVTTNVSAANTTTHGLKNGDQVKINVIPNLSVGIGTTVPVVVDYNAEFEKLLINPLTFNAADVETNQIDIEDHGFITGDKVFYQGSATGLSTGSYYVNKVSDRYFQLAETLNDLSSDPVRTVLITANTGGSGQKISPINPKINSIKNSKLTFNLSSSNLSGYEFKLFYDENLQNEFKSSSDSTSFNVSSIGNPGSVGAALTISYSPTTPNILYYGVEKGQFISTSDTDVVNYSQIVFIDSLFNGEYNIFDTTDETFKFSPRLPEFLNYDITDCEVLEYSTNSKNTTGAIKDLKINSQGFNYKKLPTFKSVSSVDGINANIVPDSKSIGKIKKFRINNIGYEYASDKTLQPEGFAAPIVDIDNLDVIDSVKILSGGLNYTSAPNLIVFNPISNTVVDDVSMIAKVPNQSVTEVEVVAPINGLDSVEHLIIPINNSNGIGINSILSNPQGLSGIVTCFLETPFNGFPDPQPFAIGDEIFVEGIQRINEVGIGTQQGISTSSTVQGDGYNSIDHNYGYFTVSNYIGGTRARLEFNLAGVTTNPGIAKTFQSGYATIVNKNVLPQIIPVQSRGQFLLNEELTVNGSETDLLIVTEIRDDYIKVDGLFVLRNGDRIVGKTTNVSAEIVNANYKKSLFKINYSSRQDYGWLDDIGKLNLDTQVIPDNDYYQNLSYSVRSPIVWDKFINTVNSLVHPAGMKNFADTTIQRNTQSGIQTVSSSSAVVIDLLNDPLRVDAINNFDFATDFDRIGNKSNNLVLATKQLTDFSKCISNRVLVHDDISDKFSSVGFAANNSVIEEISNLYQSYIIQIIDPDTFDTQLSELIVYTSEDDTFLVEKSSDTSGIGLNNTNTNLKLGDFDTEKTDTGVRNLLFNPVEKFTKDHNIKVLKTNYDTNSLGIGTNTVGNVSLTGLGKEITSSTTETIIEYPKTNFNGFYAKIFTQDSVTKEINYNEIVCNFDGTNVVTSEIFTDKQNGFSLNSVGILTSKFENNLIKLQLINDTSNNIKVNGDVVGLGTTTTSSGTFRYLVAGQIAGFENSLRLESSYSTATSSPITYSTIDKTKDSTVKTLVRVSCGQTSAIHQVVTIRDADDVLTVQYPFVSIGSTNGLGSFDGVVNGSNINLRFTPDSNIQSLVEVQAFNQIFNTDSDFDNTPPKLSYGTNDLDLFLATYDGLEGKRANKTKFELTHEGTPIYSKTFNPDGVGLAKSNGMFTINNHFFNTNEELIYTPDTTFAGVAATAVSIGQTTLPTGITTDILPSTVFVKIKDENNFQLFPRKVDVNSGVAITFTGIGAGNAHRLSMTKSLSKTIIGLDGIVQQPINFTSITHNLDGAINNTQTQFALSGISSILTSDVLKIDDEYLKIEEVGFTSTADGSGQIDSSLNISLGISTFPTVKVERGVLGISASSHADNSLVRVHRGSFNIVDSFVHFIEPPKGNTRSRKTNTELPFVKAKFSGRTFTRQNYTTNMLFDDISDEFTGLRKDYKLTVGGANTSSGIQVGNGIVLINGVFQTPFTTNNEGHNYIIEADTTAGISTISFTGITSTNGQPIVSESDINQNQIPRGGLIVSLGSTTGLGYAPLVGAKVKPFTNSSGTITSVVGVGTSSGVPLGIQTAAYDHITGIITVTTDIVHGFSLNRPNTVKLERLEFSCANQHAGVTTTFFQDHDRALFLVGIVSERTIEVQAGPSTIPHIYQGGGDVFEFFEDLTFGSGYRGNMPVPIEVVDINFLHKFVSSSNNSISVQGSSSTFTPTDAIYDSATGSLTLSIAGHGLTTSNKIKIATNSLVFTCDKDGHFSNHPYPRSTDPANNVFLTITAVTTDTITVNVGAGGGGGTGANITASQGPGGVLSFNIVSGGSGYINPQINVPEPNLENLTVEGISRLGVGPTTVTGSQLLLDVEVSAASTSVGIGSTLFEIKNFKVARSGHSFKKGDKFRPVGLVTALGFSAPVQEFELEVLEIINDKFSSWQFGEIDFIDSISILQDGSRTRFPIFFNGELLSFEKDPTDSVSQQIDLDAVLLIFVNGVLQTPKEAYQFEGGSTFTFLEAPDVDDKVDIFFYKGEDGVDIKIADIKETVKIGDTLFVSKNDRLPGITTTQSRDRIVKDILNTDRVETDIYVGRGIDEKNKKPIKWIKQKTDLKLNGVIVDKTRPIIEPQIYPTAKIIGDLSVTSGPGVGDNDGIFVDDATSFFYEDPVKGGAGYSSGGGNFIVDSVDALITSGDINEGATITATISSGSLTGFTITNAGSGYADGTIDIKLTEPLGAGTTVGSASTATATATFSGGSLVSTNVTAAGSGFTVAPRAILPLPPFKTEKITGIDQVEGFVGIITGIKNVSRSGGRALKFFYHAVLRDADGKLDSVDAKLLEEDYPVLVTGTSVGSGATSVVTTNSNVVGIGTAFVDNIYIVKSPSDNGSSEGEFTANIHTNSNSSIAGIDTTGFYNGTTGITTALGFITWGRLYGNSLKRSSNPISIDVKGRTLSNFSVSGLSTFPTIQRKSYDNLGERGHRGSGSIRADITW